MKKSDKIKLNIITILLFVLAYFMFDIVLFGKFEFNFLSIFLGGVILFAETKMVEKIPICLNKISSDPCFLVISFLVISVVFFIFLCFMIVSNYVDNATTFALLAGQFSYSYIKVSMEHQRSDIQC